MIESIIFLDIDGVLNSLEWLERIKSPGWEMHEAKIKQSYNRINAIALFNLDPLCLENLLTLLTHTQSYIVITSTWREGHDRGYFNWLFQQLTNYWPDHCVAGCTPIMDDIKENKRETEIKSWMKQHHWHGKYLAIDDEDVYTDIPHIITDRNVGLQSNDVLRAIEILRRY